jgi:arylsulfatase
MIADSTLEGQRPLPDSTITIAKVLKAAGYTTGMTGKWGLGAPHTGSIPTRMGFDFFCGYNCQRQAHTYYPVFLYQNENRLPLSNDTIAPHKRLGPDTDPYALENYADFKLDAYAPDIMFKQMMDYVEREKEGPFFLYWASPIPHAPLQAPERWVEYYVEKFGNEDPYVGRQGYFPTRYPHATYAAMISYLDELVGELVKKLKEEGLYENTLILFSSDNGPTYNGGTDSPWFNSGGPFDEERGRGKGYLYEGGIRVPLIASWPGRIKAGSVSEHISCFQDMLPTFCEISGAGLPDGIDGISLLPELLGDAEQEEHPWLYWEFPAAGGQQAVRMGPWKGIRTGIKEGDLSLKLYNLDEDVRELNNLAAAHPAIVSKMEDIMSQEHVPAELERFKMHDLLY